jgi:hypothetical protein
MRAECGSFPLPRVLQVGSAEDAPASSVVIDFGDRLYCDY